MAPLPSSILSARHVNPSSISDLSISSLELDRRSSPPDLPSYLSTLPLSDRERLNTPSTTTTSLLGKRAPVLSPHDAGALLRARDPARDTTANNANSYSRGAGTISPNAINNKGVLALFGLLSASLVFASIWFFFWAKNGGFVWRKGDWEEYKSTVLRRKGPDGKTLSNATKRTMLGGGSVVGGSMGTYEDESVLDVKEEGKKLKEQGKGKGKGKGNKSRAGGKGGRDADVRAYRHEKPARVGGLNRQPDGSYHDYSNTEPSELAPSTYAYVLPHERRETFKDKDKKNPRQPSYTVGSEASFSVISSSTATNDDRRPLRSSPHHNHHRHHRSEHASPSPAHTPTANRSRQSSPRKHHSHRPSASQPQSRRSDRYTEPIDFESRYSASEVETVETGTKSYFHPIPGLGGGKAVVEKKQKGSGGNGGGGGGFRRGTGGRARRDSLSDSEGETDAYTVRS